MSQVPLWVYGLLAVLVYVGYLQSRPREVPSAVVFAVGAGMALWSLSGVVMAFSAAALPLAAWLLGMTASTAVGSSVLSPKGVRHVPGRQCVHIPGSWTPMVLILGIFVVKSGLGFAAGMGAPVTATSPYAIPVALALGLLSGGFSARAVEVWRVSRTAKVTA